MLTSCLSNDYILNKKTSAKITLQNSNGEIKPRITIYAYDERTWETIGDNPQFANFQVASGNDGIATFTNLTTDFFNKLSNFTQTYRFSVHYNLNGTDVTKVKAITFNLGDDKSGTIILN